MSTAPESKLYTFDLFCELVPNGQKADLIDGVIYMASPDNTDAATITGWLYAVMSLFAESEDLGGQLYTSGVAFRLDDTNGPEPDIAYVRKDRRHLVQRGYVKGPPDLAIEVVSPDSVERDYEDKRKQYEQAGVTEYWIVDELKKKVILLRLGRKGKYRRVRAKQGKLHSEVLPGFWIRPAWLGSDPLPKLMATVTEMLSGK